MSRVAYAAVGFFLVVGLFCVAYLAMGVGTPFQTNRECEIRALFDDVAGLKTGNRVDVSGVPVGRVSAIELSKEGGALVIMDLNKKLDIPDDTIASIRMSGLMGEQYVSLRIGGSDVLLDEKNNVLYDTEPAVDMMGMISKFAFSSIDSEDSEKASNEPDPAEPVEFE